MKNLQKLLIIAAFTSIVPSATVICSEEPQKSMEQLLKESLQDLNNKSDSILKKINTEINEAEALLQEQQEAIKLAVKKEEKKVEENILLNTAYFGAACFLSAAARTAALVWVQTELPLDYGRPKTHTEHLFMEKLAKKIKISRTTMGISGLAILAPVIIPAAVDKINAMNETKKQKQENDDLLKKIEDIDRIGNEIRADITKELNKKTV